METRLVEALRLPIIKKFWTLEDLEKVLVQAIIDSALKCYHLNEGQIFTALSGGLDSSFALAVIRKKFGYSLPIHTFTISSSSDHPDTRHALIVAEAFKTIHHTVMNTHAPSANADIVKNNPLLFEDGEQGLGPYYLLDAVRELGDTIKPEKPRVRFGLIVHDGIDELLGGYWNHRKDGNHQNIEGVFRDLWYRLEKEHLQPLHRKADHFYIRLFFPYLQPEVIEYISRIPVEERTSRAVSKIPLRRIADNGEYMTAEIARPIIERPKIGFCDALKTFPEK